MVESFAVAEKLLNCWWYAMAMMMMMMCVVYISAEWKRFKFPDNLRIIF